MLKEENSKLSSIMEEKIKNMDKQRSKELEVVKLMQKVSAYKSKKITSYCDLLLMGSLFSYSIFTNNIFFLKAVVLLWSSIFILGFIVDILKCNRKLKYLKNRPEIEFYEEKEVNKTEPCTIDVVKNGMIYTEMKDYVGETIG